MQRVETTLLVRVRSLDANRGKALADASVDPGWPLARHTGARRSAAHRDHVDLLEIRDRREHAPYMITIMIGVLGMLCVISMISMISMLSDTR
jgi:hypothetical protein